MNKLEETIELGKYCAANELVEVDVSVAVVLTIVDAVDDAVDAVGAFKGLFATAVLERIRELMASRTVVEVALAGGRVEVVAFVDRTVRTNVAEELDDVAEFGRIVEADDLAARIGGKLEAIFAADFVGVVFALGPAETVTLEDSTAAVRTVHVVVAFTGMTVGHAEEKFVGIIETIAAVELVDAIKTVDIAAATSVVLVEVAAIAICVLAKLI